jgi:pilus assembly protein CpaC
VNGRKSIKMGRLNLLFLSVVSCFCFAFLPSAHASPQNPAGTEQVLHIFVGKSVLINVQQRLKRVLSSNPAAVETLVTSPTQVVVEGKAAGGSSLILWDEAGNSQMLDVIVELDVSELRAAIERAYPKQQIAVLVDGGRLILSGSVSAPRVADELVKLAGQYGQVVNSLTVPVSHDRQILLEVKFAEVDRTKLDQLGFNIISTGAANTPGTISTQQFGPPAINGQLTNAIGAPLQGFTTSLNVTDLLNIFLFRPDLNLGATIKDLEQRSVLEILAEPNLVALNGQKASFLSGGEFPFPVVQAGQNIGAVTIQFRPFGVRLDFTADIDTENVVRLHVAPEVSSLDFTNSITISGFTIPAISTRRAETELELKDGQSFGIAGLLDHRAQAQMSKIPGIGDIPILGQLFRSKSINRSNAELLVLVTPHIVDPVRVETPVPSEPKPVIPFLNAPSFDNTLPGHAKTETPAEPPVSK